jgi:hypothetical protein
MAPRNWVAVSFTQSFLEVKPVTTRRIEAEHRRLRKAQADAVMPKIGGLLDAWEGLSNDLKAQIEEESALGEYLDEIDTLMETAE